MFIRRNKKKSTVHSPQSIEKNKILWTMDHRPWTGFTLLEVLVVTGLFGLLFAAVFQVLAGSKVLWNTGNNRQMLENQLRIGFNHMYEELVLSNPLYVNTSGGVTNVTFKIPIGYNNSSVIWGAENVTNQSIRFLKDTNNYLKRQILGTDPAMPPLNESTLAHHISKVSFVLCPGNESCININMTAKIGNMSRGFSSIIRYRN